jgi:hypothetical protein
LGQEAGYDLLALANLCGLQRTVPDCGNFATMLHNLGGSGRSPSRRPACATDRKLPLAVSWAKPPA